MTIFAGRMPAVIDFHLCASQPSGRAIRFPSEGQGEDGLEIGGAGDRAGVGGDRSAAIEPGRDRGELAARDAEIAQPPRQAEPGKPHPRPAREFTAREAVRTRAFWLISLGHGFALFSVTAVNVHSISHIKQHMGYSLAESSFFITMVIAAQVGGILLGWFIGDRWEKRYIAAICMFVHMVGLLLLAYALNFAMLVAAALLHGGAWGLRGPFMQAIRADYFGVREIGMIMGLSSLIVVIGQIGGPMVAGGTADLTGNYQLGLTILAFLAGIGSVFFFLAKKPL